MSPRSTVLDDLVRAARRRVRRDVALAVVGAALLVVPATLGLAWLLAGASPWIEPSAAPLLIETVGLVLMALIVAGAWRRWQNGTGERDLASTADDHAGLAPGSVLAMLELGRSVPAGTSSALFRREHGIVGLRFAGSRPAAVAGRIGARARRRVVVIGSSLAGLSAVLAVVGFTRPDRTGTAWTPLLHPLAHLASPPLPPLEVEPGDVEVERGSDLAIRVRADGRFAITVVWRAEGDIPRRETASVLDERASVLVKAIDAVTQYWVEAPDGARSRVFTITPRDPLLVTDLTVVARYPGYTGRSPDRYATDVPPLELPKGTVLLIEGHATRELDRSALDDGAGTTVRMDVDGTAFHTTWVPSVAGGYDWDLSGDDGSVLMSPPAPLEITLLPDAPPDVEITFPGRDTLIDASRIHAIVGDARDDYGIAGATVVSWRISAAGRADPPIEMTLPVDSGGDRVLVRGILDLRQRDVLPGDTIRYFIRVSDNSPEHQTGVSTTFALYLPGAAELRDRVTTEAERLARDAEELAQRTRDLNDATRTLERRTQASNARRNDPSSRTGEAGGKSSSQGSLGFRESEQARRILEEQKKVQQDLEAMRDRIESIQRAIADAGLEDPDTRKKLDELRDLYDRMMDPGTRQQVDQLEQALDRLDPEQLRKALEQLASSQDELRQRLEDTLEDLENNAIEQKTGALAQEARELATQQQAISEALRSKTPPPQTAPAQRDLEEKAKQLDSRLEQLGHDLEARNRKQAAKEIDQARQDVNGARDRMEQAARKASLQQSEQAAQAGEQAANRLEQAADRLDDTRKGMANASQQAMQEAIERATNEALSLAQREQALQEQMQQQANRTDSLPDSAQSQDQVRQQDGQRGQQQQSGQRGQQQQGGQRGQQQQGGQRGQQQQGGQGGQQQQSGQRGQQQQGGTGQQQGGDNPQQTGQQAGERGGEGAGTQALREEQVALQQGLEQLGRNLAQAVDQAGSMSREVGAALGRANLSMQKTMQALDQAQQGRGELPSQQAGETVEALNRLALSLLNSQQQGQQQQNGSGTEQAMQQLQQIAQQQGQLNGRSNSLVPLHLQPQAMAQQLNRMAQEQRDIASRLEGVHQDMGRRDDVLGDLQAMAQEAERIARDLEGGRPPADVLARQERLFHRLLDAGRTLERDETSSERVAERPGEYTPSIPPALEASLLDTSVRYRVPTPEELRNLPPAYRRMILEYFERINRVAPGAEGRRRE